MSDYLKRPGLLNESSRDNDFFDFSEHAENLHKNMSSGKGPTVTMLVGAYGAGKSVLLNEVKKITDKSQVKHSPTWVFFECWQYPDKRDLWEGLILEVVEAIKGPPERKKLQEAYSDLPRWGTEIAKLLGSTKSAIGTILAVSVVVFLALSIEDDLLSNLLVSIIAATVIITLTGIELLIRPESKSSISRLNDYKDELENALKKHNSTLYIVLEDVDRAQELGVRFFETVSHFIKSARLKNKDIKIIVPVSEDKDNNELNKAMEKVSDNILYFAPAYTATNFLQEVFTERFLDTSTKELLTGTIDPLIKSRISVRKMKQILRNAIAKHERLLTSDFDSKLEICIAVEFSKYMPMEYGSSTLFSNVRNGYKHIPLFNWGVAKGYINDIPDDDHVEIRARDNLKKSSERFAEIRHSDTDSGTRSSKPIYSRDYLISKTYFDDL